MLRIFRAIVITLFLFLLSRAEDRRSDKNILTVATFNAEWLFDGIDDPASSPWKNNPDGAAQHISKVAQVIKSINADMVNLVEVEDLEVLARLNQDYLGGMGYKTYLIKGTDTYTGQDVGLLTRIDPESELKRTDDRFDYPIPNSHTGYSGHGSQGVSKNYYSEFDISGHKVGLVGIHFLAIPTDRERAAKREAQSMVTRNLAKREYLDNGSDVIVLGDFNDYDTFLDAAGNQPISIVFETLRDTDPTRSGDELFNVGSLLPQAERYTNWYDRNNNKVDDGGNEHSMIDHVLISQNLKNFVTSVSVDHTHDPAVVSDHWPLIVKFDFQQPGPTPVDGTVVYTGLVASDMTGEVHPLIQHVPYYLKVDNSFYPVLTSTPSSSTKEYMDLSTYLGKVVSVVGKLQNGAVYEAKFKR